MNKTIRIPLALRRHALAQAALLLLALSSTLTLDACKGQGPSVPATESSTPAPAVVLLGDTVGTLGPNCSAILQTRNGDTWYGTDGKGVFRRHGNTLVQFSTRHGLCNDWIRDIQEDASGKVYFSTRGGVCLFDGQIFQRLDPIDGMPMDWMLLPEQMWFGEMDGNAGPSTYDGSVLRRLPFPKHPMADSFMAQHPSAPYSPYDIYSIFRDSRGAVWLGTSNLGVCRFDGSTLAWMYEEQQTYTPSGGSFGIRSVIEDRDGLYWICNTRHRYRILPGYTQRDGLNWLQYERLPGITGLKTPRGEDALYFMNAVRDAKGDLWLQTYQEGVWRNDGAKLARVPIEGEDAEMRLRCLYLDQAGGIWLGTEADGLRRLEEGRFVGVEG